MAKTGIYNAFYTARDEARDNAIIVRSRIVAIGCLILGIYLVMAIHIPVTREVDAIMDIIVASIFVIDNIFAIVSTLRIDHYVKWFNVLGTMLNLTLIVCAINNLVAVPALICATLHIGVGVLIFVLVQLWREFF